MAKHKIPEQPAGGLEAGSRQIVPEGSLVEIWKSRWLRKRTVAAIVVATLVIGGLAQFASSVDTIGTFFEKHFGLQGFGHKALLPTLLRQAEEDCVRPDRNCRVELWLRNPNDKTVYVTALSFRVLNVDTEPILGYVESSHTYPIDLKGLSRVGMTYRTLLHQEIDAGKSDRFVISLGASDLHDRFRHWLLEAKLETSAGILPIRPLTIHLPWDPKYSAGPPAALPMTSNLGIEEQ